jgi:AcrR family transcriptional regulator
VSTTIADAAEPPKLPVTGLRARKKWQRRQAIASAARHLALEYGLDGFTVDDVAARARVSPRTFFNYFDTKETALIGVDHGLVLELGQELLKRPRSERPLTALQKVFISDEDNLAEVAENWVARLELARRHPKLMPYHLAVMHDVEQELTANMRKRLACDDLDPFPTIVVSAAVNAVRSVLSWWYENGQPGNVNDYVDHVFHALGKGLGKRVHGLASRSLSGPRGGSGPRVV